mmetsp:Transcript_32434/g.78769  ORF Transcript_32434/g.78769 Transcript_32434/m.78769 type:complete len:203 (+) Transcript_32434:686-1294(+)
MKAMSVPTVPQGSFSVVLIIDKIHNPLNVLVHQCSLADNGLNSCWNFTKNCLVNLAGCFEHWLQDSLQDGVAKEILVAIGSPKSVVQIGFPSDLVSHKSLEVHKELIDPFLAGLFESLLAFQFGFEFGILSGRGITSIFADCRENGICSTLRIGLTSVTFCDMNLDFVTRRHILEFLHLSNILESDYWSNICTSRILHLGLD